MGVVLKESAGLRRFSAISNETRCDEDSLRLGPHRIASSPRFTTAYGILGGKFQRLRKRGRGSRLMIAAASSSLVDAGGDRGSIRAEKPALNQHLTNSGLIVAGIGLAL